MCENTTPFTYLYLSSIVGTCKYNDNKLYNIIIQYILYKLVHNLTYTEMIDFGGRLKSIRQKMGLTQQEFADKLGLAQSFYSLCESNKAFLALSKSEVLFKEFGVSPQWFFSPEDYESVIMEKPLAKSDLSSTQGIDAFHKLIELFYNSQDQIKTLTEILLDKDAVIKQKDEEIFNLTNEILNCGCRTRNKK